MSDDQNGRERRAVQRDWVGHGIQAFAIVAVLFLGIGIPLLLWAGEVNTKMVTGAKDDARLASDILADRIDNRAFQTEMRTALTSLSATISELRVQLAMKDGGKR